MKLKIWVSFQYLPQKSINFAAGIENDLQLQHFGHQLANFDVFAKNSQYLENELKNIEEVFIENGFTKNEIKNAIKPKIPPDITEEETNRDLVLMPNIHKQIE